MHIGLSVSAHAERLRRVDLSSGRLKSENAGVENAGVAAMERQSNTNGISTTRRQSSVFTNVATFVTYIIIIIC